MRTSGPSSERGASSVEYALLIVGIVTAILLWTGPLGDAVMAKMDPWCEYISGGSKCEVG